MTPQPLKEPARSYKRKHPVPPQISLRALVVMFLVALVATVYFNGL